LPGSYLFGNVLTRVRQRLAGVADRSLTLRNESIVSPGFEHCQASPLTAHRRRGSVASRCDELVGTTSQSTARGFPSPRWGAAGQSVA
jgi:hypothetical protein